MVLLTGDFVAHFVNIRGQEVKQSQIQDVRDHIKKLAELLTAEIKDIPFFVTQGNNDFYTYNSAPYKSADGQVNGTEYLEMLLKEFFVNHPGNARFEADVKTDFMKNGYYKIAVNDKISLLSLNGIAFNKGQRGPAEEAKKRADE